MHDFLLHVATAGVSFLVGALLSRIWDRARPLVVLQGFTEVFGPEKVDCPDELVRLTDESWDTPVLNQGKNPVADIGDVHKAAKTVAEQYERALEKIPKLITRLQAAQTQADTLSALRDLTMDVGVSRGLDGAIKSDAILVPASVAEGQALVDIDEGEDSYQIRWQFTSVSFSVNLARLPGVKLKLNGLVNALRYAEKDKISNALQAVLPHIQKQVNIHNKIVNLTSPIVEVHGQWAAKVIMVNYGAAPMMIWPEAKLLILDQEKKKYEVLCDVFVESKEEPRFKRVVGVHVLTAGQEIPLWVMTRGGKGKTAEKSALRSYYEATDPNEKANAQVVLQVKSRGSLAPHARSKMADFTQNVEFPG